MQDALPKRPIPRILFAVVHPLQRFFRTQSAGGIVLLLSTVAALFWANGPASHSYHAFFHAPIAVKIGARGITWPLHHWINDALMAVFFLMAGMEIKRELVVGELRTLGRAALPLIAALGGMLVPAGIHFAFNHAGPARGGWGIPMATDIAFALGCLALVKRRVPTSLFVFLAALAIFDDLGAIGVIAVFYGQSVAVTPLLVAAGLTLGLIVLSRSRVQAMWPYLLLGVPLWFAILKSGVHATVAGVILGLAIPARAPHTHKDVLGDLQQALDALKQASPEGGDGMVAALERHLETVQPPLDRMLHGIHMPVTFIIVPLFALANAGIHFGHGAMKAALSPGSIGVFLGLALGKPVGVFGATYLAVKLGMAPKPKDSSWVQVFGISILAGIGFTMSIFIAGLAFPGIAAMENAAKVGVFAASTVCASGGLLLLRMVGKEGAEFDEEPDLQVTVDLPAFADGFRMHQWHVTSSIVGHSLAEVNFRRRYKVNVLGIWHRDSEKDAFGQRKLHSVEPDYRIQEGDILLLVGKGSDMNTFEERWMNPDSETPASMLPSPESAARMASGGPPAAAPSA